MDPQRIYTGEDLAWTGAYLFRSLTAYKVSKDEKEANTLVPDLATDTGTPSRTRSRGSSRSRTARPGRTARRSPVRTSSTASPVPSPRTSSRTARSTRSSYLDIPKDKDGASVYKGPYVTKGNDTAAFDKAVTCDGSTITFNLALPGAGLQLHRDPRASSRSRRPRTPVRSTTTSLSPTARTRSRSTRKGSQMVLVRNDNWSPESDPTPSGLPGQDRDQVRSGPVGHRPAADPGRRHRPADHHPR